MAKFGRIVKGAASKTGRAGANVARGAAIKATTGMGTAVASNTGSQFFRDIGNFMQKASKGGTVKSFNKQTGLLDFASGIKNAKSESIGGRLNQGALKAGYISRGKTGEINDINYGKIAKGYVAASAGARIITGGGLYKDNQGNTNVVGIPFI